jgi:uncharacterized protein
MDITPLIPSNRSVIDGYGPGQFCISSQWVDGAQLVFPDHSEPWPVADMAALSVDSFAAVLKAEPRVELVLLGTGRRMALLPSALRKELRAAGLIIEVMDSAAACRTYNVLLAEERRIVAAVLPI